MSKVESLFPEKAQDEEGASSKKENLSWNNAIVVNPETPIGSMEFDVGFEERICYFKIDI